MNQQQFESRYAPEWQAFEAWLKLDKHPQRQNGFDAPQAYRRLTQQLSLAQSRYYSPMLINHLQQLVFQGHQLLYRQRTHLVPRLAVFFSSGLPRLVRAEWRLLLLASLLFFGPLFGMLVTIQWQPELVYSVIDAPQVRELEAMYSPELHSRLGREREASSDVLMFGFYLRNNTGIGFQTFAGGLAGGLGSAFVLIFNGLFIGSAAGHLTQLGYISTFWGFVAGHSAFELGAIVLSGQAGLLLGRALLAPGRRSRLQALHYNGQRAIRIVFGAIVLFLLAAVIEAFWSSLANVRVEFKYAFGLLMWSLLLSYLLLMGRQRAD